MVGGYFAGQEATINNGDTKVVLLVPLEGNPKVTAKFNNFESHGFKCREEVYHLLPESDYLPELLIHEGINPKQAMYEILRTYSKAAEQSKYEITIE